MPPRWRSRWPRPDTNLRRNGVRASSWALRPFPLPALLPAVRRTLHRLLARRESRYGIVPSENWHGGGDPWTAPTAWSAWALAVLAREGSEGMALRAGDRRAALHLMAD